MKRVLAAFVENASRFVFLALIIFISQSRSSAFAALSEAEIRDLIKTVDKIYQPVAKEAGGRLFFKFRPESESIVASAHADGKDFWVVLDGGFLTASNQSKDAFLFGVCHELGHLFGGAPRRTVPFEYDGSIADDGLSLLTSEAQSDYYASFVCFRAVVAGENHSAELKKQSGGRAVPEAVVRACDQSWGSGTSEAGACYRAALGGKGLLNLVRVFPISFDTPDSTEVERTNYATYPNRQCRLDTVLAGAVCRNSGRLRLDFYRPLRDGCLEGSGARPRCWFQPSDFKSLGSKP